jgi:hypothetical protein
MIRNIVGGILLLAMTCDVSAADIDECLRPFIDVESVRALVTAKTTASLRAVRAKSDFRSSVTAAVYALRCYELSKTHENETRLIGTIPRSDVELLLLYRLSFPDIALPERPDLFSDYLQAIYAVVRRSRRGYVALLRLGALAQGGELGETISSFIQQLYDSDAAGVDRALVSMPESERKLVCGEEGIPCPRAKMQKDR